MGWVALDEGGLGWVGLCWVRVGWVGFEEGGLGWGRVSGWASALGGSRVFVG